ncbi:MAG: DUF411 domain-containing protein [Rhodospirillales bacterium]|nr:DUF411 domain-containing protein [Rhodospirillales bacterium]
MNGLAGIIVALVLSLTAESLAGDARVATLYKDPDCGCCEGHARYLEANGFKVDVKPTQGLAMLRKMLGVPESLAGCHTIVIDGYVVEGHVSAPTIRRLLAERPKITGISLPGMPVGSPGMEGPKSQPFVIYEIGPGEPKTYAVE